MLERVYYQWGICLVCALVLLIAVMTSPLLPSRTDSKSFQVTCLTRNFSTPPPSSARHCCKGTADGNMADAAEFGGEVENEEEEECFVGVIGPVSVVVGRPLSTSLKRLPKRTKAFDLMQSSPMLRC